MSKRQSLPKFCAKCTTHAEYLADAPDTPYTKRIRKGLLRNPNATLAQLRGHPSKGSKPLSKLKKKPTWEFGWEELTPQQRSKRLRSLGAVSVMKREKWSLNKACLFLGIDAKTVLNNLGNALTQVNGRWQARRGFKCEVGMVAFVGGEEKRLLVPDYRSIAVLRQYHKRLRDYLRRLVPLVEWELDFPMIKDAQGALIKLENDPRRVLYLLERKESEDYYEIYTEE